MAPQSPWQLRSCGQGRDTYVLDMIEAQWWSPSCVFQRLCRKGLIVTMYEAAEGMKVAQQLRGADVPEQGGERAQVPGVEPTPLGLPTAPWAG